LVLLQLQQVPAAGESPEVPVKDEQEPMALIVTEPVHASVSVWQFEWNSPLTLQVDPSVLCHDSPPVGAVQHMSRDSGQKRHAFQPRSSRRLPGIAGSMYVLALALDVQGRGIGGSP
jgi:hypothetical protein